MSDSDDSASSNAAGQPPALAGACSCQQLESFLRPNLVLRLENLAQVGAETRLSAEKSRHRDTEREYQRRLAAARTDHEASTARYEAQITTKHEEHVVAKARYEERLDTQQQQHDTAAAALRKQVQQYIGLYETTKNGLSAKTVECGRLGDDNKMLRGSIEALEAEMTQLKADLAAAAENLVIEKGRAATAENQVAQLKVEQSKHEEQKRQAELAGAAREREVIRGDVREQINSLLPGNGKFELEYPRDRGGRTMLDEHYYLAPDHKVKKRS